MNGAYGACQNSLKCWLKRGSRQRSIGKGRTKILMKAMVSLSQ